MNETSFTDDFLDSLVIKDTGDLKDTIRQNVLATSPINPDQYAEATKLGRAQNVPPRFVAADFDRYKNTGKIDDTLLDNIVTNAPAYYDWLSQQDNMALTHDDVGGLTFAFDRVRSIGASLIGDVAGRTIEGTGGQLNSLAYLAADGEMKRQQYEREKWNGQRTMFLPDIMPEAVDRALGTATIGLLSMAGETLEFSGSSLRRFADWMAPPEHRRNTFNAFLGGLTQGVSTLAMTYLNRPMAIISTLAQGSTQAMDEAKNARAQGKEVDERGEAIGTLTAGVITSATEMPVMDAILKRFPQANAIFEAVPDQFKKPAFEFIGKLAIAGGAEGLQEAAEGFLQRINTQLFINPEREDYSLSEAGGDAGLGASVGATMQGLVYLALHISNRRVPHAMEEQLNRELQKEQVKQTVQAIRDTKLNSRDPVKMAEVLKAGNTEGKRVTLDGTVVQQFYQSGIDPDEFFNLAPSAREQFEQAQVAGTDVSIPLDEFLHAITAAPEQTYDFMTDFMKVDPDADPMLQGWDMTNPDDVNAFIQQAMRQSRQDWDNENESVPNTVDVQIERKLRDMLMNSDVMGEKVRNAEAAATEASALAAYFRTRLAKGGDAAERVFMGRILSEGAFSVEGPQVTLKKRIGTGSAYYDRLRKKVMADRRIADKKLASGKRSRRKATKTPLMNAIIARGGIREDGPVAAELRHMGITPKTHRKLFKGGKLNSLDNIEAASLEEDLGTQGVFSNAEEYNGYAPEQEILDALRNEAAGDYIRSDDELAAESIEAQQQELLDTLEQEGVDITTATAEEIDAAIDNAATRYRLEYETAQPGTFYQENNAQILFNDRGQTIIKLFQRADETSLMHEAGHLFLDLDAEIARQPDAPEAFKQEFQATLEWLGVASYADVKTQHHEQFARGFEAYLYRGEAPSVALKSVFQRMKLWFTNLYRNIKTLGVDVNPQMKAVYDRLLATDDEIEAARGNPLGGIEQMTLQMLNPKQQEAYLRQHEKDMAEARDKLFRKAYRQLMRQKTEWWKEESSRVQAEVEAELQAQNIYRAIQFLQTGQDFNGDPLGENMGSFKLDEQAILAAFGGDPAIAKEELKYLPRGISTNEGGLDPEIVADMFGFASATEMLRTMQKVPPYKQAVARQTEDRMIGKHGDMLNDGTIEDEALAMVMAETTKREQIILKALAQKTGAAYPSDGDFARAAALAIGRLSVDQAVKPEKYYRAALKAARDYGRALAKKDWEAAAEAKRREIINKHLHKLSKAMREETSKTIDKFNALKKEPPKREAKKVKIDPDYHQKIWDILDKYDIGAKLSEAKRTRIEMAAMNDWIQRQIDDDGAALIMPQVLLDADRKTHYRDMTVDEFRGLRELVTNLETQGRNKRKWQTKQEKADLDERAALMAATAENSAAKEFQPSDTSNPIGWGKNLINSLDVISTKMAQVMTMMDGGDNFGVWMRSLYNPVNQAVIERSARLRTEYDKFNAIIKGYMDGLGFGYLNQQVGSYHIGTAKLTRENMLMIAMYYTGTPATRQKLVDGYEAKHGWDEAHIERILENMTEKDWNFVMDVRDYLNGFWPETSAVEASRFGYAPEKQEFLEDQQVKTADGKTVTVRGGYMRIYYDPEQDVGASNNQVKETFEDMKVFKSARSATKNGSMIEQVDGVKRPMLLSMDNISSHIQETVTHITMAETIDNALKLTRHKDVQETLFKYLGREGKQMVDLWLQDVVAGGALSGGTINRWLRAVRSNYTIGRLSFRPLTALIQVSGLIQTAADSDLRPHLFGAMANYAGMGELTKKDIMDSSTFMRERRFALNRDIADSITYYRQQGKYVSEKVAVIGLWALQKVQEQVDVITWTAGYRYATERGMTRDDAIAYADNAVDRLQGGGNVTNLAGVERGTLSNTTQRQEWVKAAFPFYSYFNAKYNLLKNTNIKYQNGEITGVDVAISYTLAMLVEGFVSAALMGQLDFDDDDDDEISGGEAAWGMAKIAMGQYAASVPFLRDAASGAEGFTSQKGAIGAIMGLGELSHTLVKETGNAVQGEEVNGQKIFRQAVDAIGVFTPFPSGAVNQFSRGIQMEQEGDDPSVLDYLVYRQ